MNVLNVVKNLQNPINSENTKNVILKKEISNVIFVTRSFSPQTNSENILEFILVRLHLNVTFVEKVSKGTATYLNTKRFMSPTER